MTIASSHTLAPGQQDFTPGHGVVDGRERLLAFAFAAADLLMEVDGEGTVTFAAGAFPSRFGHAAAEAVGRPLERFVAAEDQTALHAAVSALARHGRLRPMAIRLADRERWPCALAGLALPVTPPRYCLTFGPLPLPFSPPSPSGDTGRGFARVAEARLRSSSGSGTARLSLFEIEGLAEVSAMLGRESREALLDTIGKTIVESAPGGAAGEFGGGRWALMHAGEADPAATARTLESVLRARAPATATPRVAGADLALVTTGFTGAQQIRALRLALETFASGGLAALDAAGFSGGLQGFLVVVARKAESLRSRLQRRGFKLLFQPVVDLADRRPHHFEALIRPGPAGESPTETPQTFVTLVEAAGLSAELDLAVMSLARETVAAARSCTVAVNLSATSLQDPRFRTALEDTLAVLPDLNRRLLFEVAETVEIDDVAAARATLERLRSLGFPVCLDGFGATASSLRHLRMFGFDYVKIDGACIAAARTAERDRQLLAHMVDLCLAAGAKVIADWIETEEDAAMVRDLGVTYGQGYLFGRPGHLPGLVAR